MKQVGIWSRGARGSYTPEREPSALDGSRSASQMGWHTKGEFTETDVGCLRGVSVWFHGASLGCLRSDPGRSLKLVRRWLLGWVLLDRLMVSSGVRLPLHFRLDAYVRLPWLSAGKEEEQCHRVSLLVERRRTKRRRSGWSRAITPSGKAALVEHCVERTRPNDADVSECTTHWLWVLEGSRGRKRPS